jgi:hypothetical protein
MVQLGRRGAALHAATGAFDCFLRDECCCPLLKSSKRAILASNPPGICRLSAQMGLMSLYRRLEMARLSNVSPGDCDALYTRRHIRRAFRIRFGDDLWRILEIVAGSWVLVDLLLDDLLDPIG